MTTDIEPEEQERISAVAFLVKLWEEKLFIITTMLIFIVASEFYIMRSPVKYTTTMLVGHVTSVDNPGASSGSSLGGSAIALIGLGSGLSNDTKYNLFMTIIRTENFAKSLQAKYHFERRHGESTVLPSVGAVTGALGGVIVIPNGDTTMLQIQNGDRAFARELLVIVLNEGNQYVRQIDTQRAQKFAAFIENRFRTETSRPMQDALGTLLVNQERFLMITSVDLPYAVQLLDGPTSSDAPSSPNTHLLRQIGLGVGFAVSIFVVLLWGAIATERAERGMKTIGPSRIMMLTPGYVWLWIKKLTGQSSDDATGYWTR